MSAVEGEAGRRHLAGDTSGPPPLLKTRWLPIPGYEGRYEVSDGGQVRALPGPGAGRVKTARVMKLRRGLRRYWHVDLYSGGSKSRRTVHGLMLEAFVGPRPRGLFGLHNDDDRDNNVLSNLRWGTSSENTFDMIANGGSRHNAHKTHCKWGHPLEGDNLTSRSRERECRTCVARRRKARAA